MDELILGNEGIQYCILSNEFDYTEATFADLKPYTNIHYYKFPLVNSNRLERDLFRLHGSQQANRFFNLPGQSIWNSKAFLLDDFNREKPVCFIYSFRRIDRFIRSGFFSYVNQLFPKVYHIAWWDDLVTPNEVASLEYAKQNFDFVFTYDEGEAKKYGIRYYPSFYSKPQFVKDDMPIKYDICFVGYAKDRLNEIYCALNVLESNGLKCHFVLNGVPYSLRRSSQSIIYDEHLGYEDVVHLSAVSRCVLEIVQKNSVGQSLRVNEAFVLGKRLLSNNPSIRSLPQYDSRFMRTYDGTPSKRDAQFVKSSNPVEYSYPLLNVSPIRFIEHIDELLVMN